MDVRKNAPFCVECKAERVFSRFDDVERCICFVCLDLHRKSHGAAQALHRAAWIRAGQRSNLKTLKCEEGRKILLVFEKAQLLSRKLKIKFQVDHAVPLNGETVSGLHNWHNLQLMDASSNSSKSNRTWPDSWNEPLAISKPKEHNAFEQACLSPNI